MRDESYVKRDEAKKVKKNNFSYLKNFLYS